MAWLIAASGAQYGRRARDMEIRVLGPVEASVGGRPVALGAGKPRALLAMLALNAGSAVSVDRLIEGLWGERPPATAGKLLQVYVSRLRTRRWRCGGGRRWPMWPTSRLPRRRSGAWRSCGSTRWSWPSTPILPPGAT